ncbi:hypothetical protein [Terriglobus roseus]|uniref:hypothetical protein n=1 Tax=Terriglobus roseus TaxID=392734 RepID=UPI001BAF3976|nr:hypothetical protein [Terriglobus roseus]
MQKTVVHFQRYAGHSLDGQLAAALAAHAGSSAPLLLIQDTAGRFAADAKLPADDDLLFNASAVFEANAHVVASGRNRISCGVGVTLSSTSPNASLIRADGDNIDVGNCKANGAGGAAAVVATSIDRHAKHLRIHDLTVTNIGVTDLAGADDAEVWNFDATASSRGGTLYVVVIRGDATHVHVHDGKVKLFAHGVEWFNADANLNKGGPRTRAQVAAHGGWYTVENLQCDSVIGACVWGSVAHDILSRNNQSQNAGDVGFDCEGCIDYRSENDSSVEATNAGFATFFYSNNNVFVGAHHTSSTGKNGVMIFNDSQAAPMNSGTSVVNGVFNCFKVPCFGVGGNAAQGIQVTGSQFLNASITPNGFWSGPTIKNNHFVTRVATGPAINLGTLLGGMPVTVESNSFKGDFKQAAGVPCIALKNVDYNASVSVVLRQNRCLSDYTVDWDATSGSGNAGVGMNLTLDRNIATHSGLSLHGFGGRDRVTK